MKNPYFLLALLCLASPATQARPQASFPLVLKQLKAAPLQPQSLRLSLMPDDIKEINARIAEYAKKRGESPRRTRTPRGDDETKAFLIGLTTKAYALSLRGASDSTGKQARQEAFGHGLAEAAKGRPLTPQLRALAQRLGGTSTPANARKKKSESSSTTEKATKVATAAATAVESKVSEEASAAVDTMIMAASAVVDWLSS